MGKRNRQPHLLLERIGWLPAYGSMPITSSLFSTILAAALFAGSLPLSKTPVSATQDEIARLDACIQARFLDTRTFGMSRVATTQYHRSGHFVPENEAERAVIGELKDKHYDVGFFLLGRFALGTPPSPIALDTHGVFSPNLVALRRRGVQGPAFITPLGAEDLPKPEALLDEARDALLSFDSGQGYNIQQGDWTVAMRPLRASTQKCVQCHVANSGAGNLKIGDGLGVAMYVYRSKSPL
jgi:hypothetical protein